MSVRLCGSRGSLLLLVVVALVAACAGQKLYGEVEGTQTALQRAIRDGSKSINCAPKETAIAEAHIKFAQDALASGEYYRGKQHAETAEYNTQRARELTSPERCRDRGVAVIGDRDGDGYDDEIDKCPDEAEDFDSFEDDDGCPDPDNDGDEICDPWVAATGQSEKYAQICKGTDQCPNEPEDFDGFEDEDGCPDFDNDGDGLCDPWVAATGKQDQFPCKGIDQCPDEPEDFDGFQDEDGCPDPDNDDDKICDPWVEDSGQLEKYAHICKGRDLCPDDPEDYDGDRDDDGCPDLKAEFDGCSVKIKDVVFFKFNKWDIDPRSFELLDDVATVMNQVPAELHFRIEGHTDSKGSDASNKKLSQRRADSVRNYLTGKGVQPSRLQGVGFGEERPIDSNRTADGRARNRRVEFNVSNADCKTKPSSP